MPTKKLRIAILGARGFFGTNLGRILTLQGHLVTGYTLNPESTFQNGFEHRSVKELLNSQSGAEPGFDVTINLATRRSTRTLQLSDSEVDEFTFKIPREFILRTVKPETLVINTSTYIQNFGGRVGKTVDSYGASKERLSQFLANDSSCKNFRIRDLFFFTLYGLGDRPNHLVPLLLDAALTGKKLSLSPGRQLMNLLHIDDAVVNIVKTINQEFFYGYHKNYVWSNEYLSVRELVDQIQSIIKRDINCAWGERNYIGHEMMETWTIPMDQLPGFTNPTSLEDGIGELWRSMLKV